MFLLILSHILCCDDVCASATTRISVYLKFRRRSAKKGEESEETKQKTLGNTIPRFDAASQRVGDVILIFVKHPNILTEKRYTRVASNVRPLV